MARRSMLRWLCVHTACLSRLDRKGLVFGRGAAGASRLALNACATAAGPGIAKSAGSA
eukprot:COSAG02_NODE_42974_length_379_cov_0.921429_1_plen_57_part_10